MFQLQLISSQDESYGWGTSSAHLYCYTVTLSWLIQQDFWDHCVIHFHWVMWRDFPTMHQGQRWGMKVDITTVTLVDCITCLSGISSKLCQTRRLKPEDMKESDGLKLKWETTKLTGMSENPNPTMTTHKRCGTFPICKASSESVCNEITVASQQHPITLKNIYRLSEQYWWQVSIRLWHGHTWQQAWYNKDGMCL